MDFLDPRKKRAQAIRLMIGYALVAVVIAVASLVLLLQAYGYDVDRNTGKVVQNGLVFVSSRPVSANLYINGVAKGSTSTKLTMRAGQYTAELQQTGYRTWKRSFTLEGSSIVRLAYPVLFPNKLVTKDLQLYGTVPSFASESPDRHWLLVQQPGSLTTFDNFDLNNPQNVPTALNLPKDLLIAAPGSHTLSLVEWSTDNRHVLIKHTYEGGSEFVIVDRDTPASSLNVNKIFATNPSEVALRDKNYDKLYLYDRKALTVQAADVKSKQITPLLSNVMAFKPYGADTILYASHDAKTPSQDSIKVWDGKQNYLIHNYPATTSYTLDMAGFDGHTYIVVAPKTAGYVYIYKDGLEVAKQNKLPAAMTTLKMDQASFVSFSAIARFITAQNGNHFAVYDAETDRRYYYELKDQVPADLKATWMDGHRMLLILNNKTVVFDFDGTNRQTLAAAQSGFIPFFDRDYTGLYNIAPSVEVPGRYAVTRTALTLEP